MMKGIKKRITALQTKKLFKKKEKKKQRDIRRHDERDKTKNNNTPNQKAKIKQREKKAWSKRPSHPLNLPPSQYQKNQL